MTSAIAPLRLRRVRSIDFAQERWLGTLVGLILPIAAALLYRTYQLTVASQALEITRQAGLVHLAGEVVVILYARANGLDVAAIVRALPRWAKPMLALFLASFWISSVFVSQMPAFSIMLSLGWVVHLLFAAAVYHLAAEAPIDPAGLARGFVLGLIALAVMIVVHFAAHPAALLVADPAIDWGSAIPGFISSRLFGSWCGAALALVTGIVWRHDGGQGRDRLYLTFAFLFCLTFWTATRAALLGWAVGLPVAWLLAGRPVSRAVHMRLPFYIVAAILVALALPPYGPRQYTFFRWGSLATADTVTSGRLTLWKTALEVASHYPLLGSGAGSSWWLVPLSGFYHVQPHNAVVQFLLNWGLIPTVPALALIVGATWHAHRAAARQAALLPVVLMLDCLLAMSLFDGMLHFAQFILLIVGCLALCLARLPHRMPS